MNILNDKKSILAFLLGFTPWLISFLIDLIFIYKLYGFGYVENLQVSSTQLIKWGYLLYGLVFGIIGLIGVVISNNLEKKSKKLSKIIYFITLIIASAPGIIFLIIILYGTLFPITEI